MVTAAGSSMYDTAASRLKVVVYLFGGRDGRVISPEAGDAYK